MAIHDKHIKSSAKVAEKIIPVRLVTATSQTATKAFGLTPGYGFEVVAVSTWCSAVTATATADVKIGSTSVLSSAAAFTANTEVAATLSSTTADVRGTDTDQLTVTYTTDGTGALTNGHVVVTIRVYPLAGESGFSA